MRLTSKITIIAFMALLIVPSAVMAQYVSLISPSNGATDVTIPVYLDWGGSGCEYYWLEVDDDPAFGSMEVNYSGMYNSYYNWSGAAENTTYYWRVNGHVWTEYGGYWVGFTSARSFTTECPTPTPPTLSTPADEAVDVARPVYFDWSDVADIYRYEIQIDDNSDFSSITEDYYTTLSEHTSYNMAQGTLYYWRVRGDFDNGCGWGDWGTTFSFTVECPIPDVPSLVSPAYDAADLSLPVLLDWSDVSIVNNYRVMVDDDPYFGSAEIDNTFPATASEYSASGLDNDAIYYWKVMAINACGNNGWSDIRRFSTECLPPAAPGLINPFDAAADLPLPITFSWTTITDAVNYQIQIDPDIAFSAPIFDYTTGPVTEIVYNDPLSTSTTYYWRIRGKTDGCSWSGWSSSRSFTHSCPAIGTPNLTTPSNGATEMVQPFLIDWDDASNAVTYRVMVDDDPAFGSLEMDYEISAALSTYIVVGLSEGSTYYWKVIANDDCEQSSSSSVRSFTTGSSALCGDVDVDGTVNILDIVYTINYIYKNGPEPCNPIK